MNYHEIVEHFPVGCRVVLLDDVDWGVDSGIGKGSQGEVVKYFDAGVVVLLYVRFDSGTLAAPIGLYAWRVERLGPVSNLYDVIYQ